MTLNRCHFLDLCFNYLRRYRKSFQIWFVTPIWKNDTLGNIWYSQSQAGSAARLILCRVGSLQIVRCLSVFLPIHSILHFIVAADDISLLLLWWLTEQMMASVKTETGLHIKCEIFTNNQEKKLNRDLTDVKRDKFFTWVFYYFLTWPSGGFNSIGSCKLC